MWRCCSCVEVADDSNSRQANPPKHPRKTKSRYPRPQPDSTTKHQGYEKSGVVGESVSLGARPRHQQSGAATAKRSKQGSEQTSPTKEPPQQNIKPRNTPTLTNGTKTTERSFSPQHVGSNDSSTAADVIGATGKSSTLQALAKSRVSESVGRTSSRKTKSKHPDQAVDKPSNTRSLSLRQTLASRQATSQIAVAPEGPTPQPQFMTEPATIVGNSLPQDVLIESPPVEKPSATDQFGPEPTRSHYPNARPSAWPSKSMGLVETSDFISENLTRFIECMDLGKFYSADDPYLRELCEKAARLAKDGVNDDGTSKDAISRGETSKGGATKDGATKDGATKDGATKDKSVEDGSAEDEITKLNRPEDIIDMVRLALYDVIIYCDDSESMSLKVHRGKRVEAMKELIKRVVQITSILDTGGIKIRCINTVADTRFDNIHTQEDAKNVIDGIEFHGHHSQIGTGLKSRILDPLLYEKMNRKTFNKPLLIVTITDGAPLHEELGKFRSVVLSCQNTLINRGYKPTTVVFQVSQVGDENKAEDFIRSLYNDPEVGSMVYCTSEKLDQKIEELEGNKRNLERWLLDLLTRGIRPANP